MNGDTDPKEAQAKVEVAPVQPLEGWREWLDEGEQARYRAFLDRATRNREELAGQARSIKSRIDTDIVWRLQKGSLVYTNPFTNGGYHFDEAVHRVRFDQERQDEWAATIGARRSRAQREAVEFLASLFKGGKLYLPGRKHPYRALR